MDDKTKKDILKKISADRAFAFLPRLDFYIFREFMIPFSVLTFTFILLFLIGDVFNDLDDFLEYKGADVVPLAIKYFTMKMPGNIRFVLPISVLLSCMYTVANLGRCREITAMRASGISLIRCGGAIYAAALVVTILNFWFNEQLVPEYAMKAKILIEKLDDPNYDRNMYNMLQYRSPDKSRDWLFRNFDEHGVQEQVILKQYMKDSLGKKHMAWDIHAKEAVYSPKKGWIFKDGRKTDYHELIHIPGAPIHFKTLVFDGDKIHETPYEIKNAVKAPEDLSSAEIYSILRANKDMAPMLRNTYETLLYYRLAFPWACFLCVFLGLPLAAKNERAGIFLSIVTAVAAIVIFQMMTEIFLVLGKRGYVFPIIGGMGPTFAFVLYSYFGVIRKSY